MRNDGFACAGQPRPQIEPEDINRIVRRDFPESQFDAVLKILDQYDREGYRVKAAVLKLADGKLKALEMHVEAAKRNFRDVLIAAEYPEYWRLTTPSPRKLQGDERGRVIDRDWDQYKAWLEKP